MPQEYLRSVVYRSFVTCDDPKGVVNCRTKRKSKTNSKKLEEKPEDPKMLKKLSKLKLYKEEKKEVVPKGGTEEPHRASSFQLMEVSRGAQKLNQVIDSWSRRTSFDGQSKEIGKDLLIGALDLQDSLVMLSKLQEASQYMTKLKKKQKEKPSVTKADQGVIERTSSDRFGNPNYQNPRFSTDGSSKDCYDELREVIRDSLSRQNLLPRKSSEEKAYFDRRKMNLYADMPSTSSSSISSMAYSHDFGSSESSISSKIIEEKPRASNLIAKLMGLDDFSSKTLTSASKKQLERDSNLTQKKPIFDIDIGKEKGVQFVGQKVDRGCMTLEEVIDNMQFKGLLRDNQRQSYHPNTSYMEKRLSCDSPPIVLMKPISPGIETKKHFSHNIPEDSALNSERQRFWKTKEEITSKVMGHPRGAMKSYEFRGMLYSGETPLKKLSKEKESKRNVPVRAKPQDEEANIKKKLASSKMNASVVLPSMLQKEEIIDKKVDKIQKSTTSRRKPVEIDNVKSRNVQRSPEPDKVSTTRLMKSEIGPNIMNKNCKSQHKTTSSNSATKRTKTATSCDESDLKRSVKSSKPVKESLSTNASSLVSSTVCEVADKQADLNKLHITIMDSAPAVQLLTDEEIDVSAILIQENSSHSLNALCKDSMLLTPHGNNISCPEEATDHSNRDLTETNACKTKTSTDVTLSRTLQSLHQAEDTFDNSAAYHATVIQALTGLHDCGIVNPKLLLECANELLDNRSQRHKLLINPSSHIPRNDSRVCISNDNLKEEARNWLENLRSYSKFESNRIPAADIVFSMLKRDLRYKEVGTGAWDLGWWEGFTGAEVEEIVSELDKQVLSELIEEVLSDIVV